MSTPTQGHLTFLEVVSMLLDADAWTSSPKSIFPDEITHSSGVSIYADAPMTFRRVTDRTELYRVGSFSFLPIILLVNRLVRKMKKVHPDRMNKG